MEQNEKTVAIAERDRCWADLREHKDRIVQITKNLKELEPSDFILFYQCIVIVFTEITIYEKEFLDNDDHIKKLLKDNSAPGCVLKIIREANFWRDMINKKLSREKRIAALHALRKSIWANMAIKKSKIAELMENFPAIENPEQMHTMMQCATIVILDIGLKEKEIELLY